MPVQDSESMIRQLLLSLIEAGLNKAISMHEESYVHLEQLAGRVIRIRTYGPYYSVYLLFDEAGVQVLNHYDGPVDARIRGAAVELGRFIFGPEPDPTSTPLKVRIIGDRAVVQELRAIGRNMDFWAMVRQLFKEWLPDHNGLMDILDSLRIYDPAWLDRLQHLPQSVSHAVVQLQTLAQIQQQQLHELQSIRRLLESQRKAAKVTFFVGVCSLVLGVLIASGMIQVPVNNEVPVLAWVLLVFGGCLVVPLGLQLRASTHTPPIRHNSTYVTPTPWEHSGADEESVERSKAVPPARDAQAHS